MRTQGVATSATHPGVFYGNVGERLMEEEGDLFVPQLFGHLADLHLICFPLFKVDWFCFGIRCTK